MLENYYQLLQMLVEMQLKRLQYLIAVDPKVNQRVMEDETERAWYGEIVKPLIRCLILRLKYVLPSPELKTSA